MPVVSVGSPWFYAFMLTSVHLDSLSASTSSPTLPTPTLNMSSRRGDSVVLVCRAPGGHRGLEFMLYRDTDKVESKVLQSAAKQVQFTVRMEDRGLGQHQLFCCLYRSQGGQYSSFSPYLQVEPLRAEDPTQSLPSLPPPLLSVEPSSGITWGDTLRFRCTVPAPLSQSQSNNRATFLLLRSSRPTTSVIPQLHAAQVSQSEPQPGVFTVGPVGRGEEGEYSCIYQITQRRRPVNSSVSNVVQITLTNMLPVPSLALQQQTDVWHLLCTGSPAYPGAVFSLYLEESEHPFDSQQAKAIQHQATFPVPVQDAPVALYQCQYSVLLGRTWRNSDRSVPLAVTTGNSPPAALGADWPFLLGSISAAVLFVFSLGLVAMVAHRKVKAAAEEKKRRQEAQFWAQRHAQDHVTDLRLRRTSLTTQEWSSRDTETASRSSVWSPFSTFTTPIHPVH
ncbi:uncharacterized protein LOC108244326 isoform X2 [Kryptolebias marmoratus]|nr:uncharacterized protein LOC108244326 isoform X2 [Kryptolebias marmoratus]